MKFVKWVLPIIVLLAAPFALVAAVNFDDEPLAPEVKKILEKPQPAPTEAEKKGLRIRRAEIQRKRRPIDLESPRCRRHVHSTDSIWRRNEHTYAHRRSSG